MENSTLDTNMGGDGLRITPEIREYLSETAKWGKLMAIVGFIGIGLMVLVMLGMMFFMGASGLGNEFGMMAAAGGSFIFVIYIIIFALYIFPLLYLYRFSTKIKVALDHDDQSYLAEAFRNLKSLYKFMGMLMAIMLGLYAVMFVIGLLGGAAGLMF